MRVARTQMIIICMPTVCLPCFSPFYLLSAAHNERNRVDASADVVLFVVAVAGTAVAQLMSMSNPFVLGCIAREDDIGGEFRQDLDLCRQARSACCSHVMQLQQVFESASERTCVPQTTTMTIKMTIANCSLCNRLLVHSLHSGPCGLRRVVRAKLLA